MRVTHTREELPFYFCAFFALHLLFIICQTPYPVFLQTPPITQDNFENKSALFRDFFPLWGCIPPYTYRGASLSASIFQLHFYGASLSNILSHATKGILSAPLYLLLPQNNSFQLTSIVLSPSENYFSKEIFGFVQGINQESKRICYAFCNFAILNPNRSLDRYSTIHN